MKFICLMLAGFIPFQVFAKSDQICQELKSEQIRLALTASNLANVNSTRTPDGGAYKPYVIRSCANGGCDVRRDDKEPIMKYLPHHQDADKNGFVAYPNINQKVEYSTFNLTATKLKLLVATNDCGAKVIIDNGNSSFALRYGGIGEPNVKEDIFNFDDRHQVVSWMRQDLKGASSTLNFAANGEVISHSESEQ